ncbi:MAG: ABC transporter permease [Verrucomicrobia bacterium]|nr:ABC transporter permease [Verrucomicrobiota bacterium]
MITGRLTYSRLLTELGASGVRTLVRPSTLSLDDTVTQMRMIGVGAVPTAGLIAVTAGFILALVLEVQLSQVGKVEMVPSLLWFILTEQVVPVSVALIFTGRSVSAVAAELGSMQVSEEVKALFTMGIDVVPYLLLPRFLGFQIMLPIVTLLGIYASLFGGWLLCGPVLRMSLSDYAFYALDGSQFSSVLVALGKSALFGFIIATIALYKGMNVRHGSREISEATTQSVVAAVIMVTLADAAVTALELT